MSEQAKVRKLSGNGSVIMGLDDAWEDIHLRTTLYLSGRIDPEPDHPNMIVTMPIIMIELTKRNQKYNAILELENWTNNMARGMLTGIFNGIRSWSGKAARKRRNHRIAKGLLLECKQTIEHGTTQVKSEEYNNEQK